MSKQRIPWLDILKGFAIILVVIGHVGSIYGGDNGIPSAGAFYVIHDSIYCFHMPLFFAVSGYLFSKEGKVIKFRDTVVQKAIAYGIPYIVFSVLYWLAKFLASGFVKNTVSIKDLVLIPLFPISFMWYLYALLIISVFSVFLRDVLHRPMIMLPIAIVLRVVWEVLTIIPGFKESTMNDFVIIDVIKNYIWFAVGFVYVDTVTQITQRASTKTQIWFVIIVFTLLAFVSGIHADCIPFVRCMWAILGTIASIVLAIMLNENHILEYLGKRSLPVYLLHGTIISALKPVLKKLGLPMLSGLGPMLCCTIISIVLSLVIYAVCEATFLNCMFYPTRYIKIGERKTK